MGCLLCNVMCQSSLFTNICRCAVSRRTTRLLVILSLYSVNVTRKMASALVEWQRDIFATPHSIQVQLFRSVRSLAHTSHSGDVRYHRVAIASQLLDTRCSTSYLHFKRTSRDSDK